MNPRTRFFITLGLLCHGLLLPLVVTSQLRPPQPGEASEPVTLQAREQEKAGDLYTLRGEVEVDFRNFVLRADEMTYNSATGEVTATGHVVLDGGPHDEHLQASRANYNTRSDTGKFYDVRGTTGAHLRGQAVVLTSSSPFYFQGALVEKTSPSHFVVHHGTVTSCELPKPKWTFTAERATVEVGEDAKLYHSTFRLFGVPIFYFPYASHPVDTLGRHSGFLLPNIGQSSRKGTIFGESVYWAINRSMDATLGAEYFSARGWAQHGEFRARPSENSFLNVRYFGVLDRGFETPGGPSVDQGGEEVNVDGEARLGWGVRAVSNIDYLSSYIFRQAFSETFNQAVNSEVKSSLFLSKNYGGYSFNAFGGRYQNFQSTNRGDVITIVHAPGFEASGVDQKIGRSPLYWSFDAAAEGVSRREPDFVSDSVVGRFDLYPHLSLPIVTHDWSFRPEIALRDTYYTQEQQKAGNVPLPGQDPINRRALEVVMEVRPPALSRIFEKKIAGHTFKHVIEPRLTYRYVNGVDNFPNIIRFDDRDIQSDTNELEYAVVQRIYAKSSLSQAECTPGTTPQVLPYGIPVVQSKPQPPRLPRSEDKAQGSGCRRSNGAREILSWEIKQKYFFDPTFGGALVNGQRNMFTTTADFTGIAFLTDPRRFAPVVSRLHINTSANTDVEWQLDYDTKKGRINASTALVSFRLGDFFVGGSHAYLQAPGEILVSTPVPAPTEFNQIRFLGGYGHPNKRGLTVATNLGYDTNLHFLQYGAVQASYNWNCCGVSVEFRRFALGSVRNENQIRFALSLLNVGTFGNMRRQERLY